MTSSRSARPPSTPRREPDLDSVQARQFVERAGNLQVAPATNNPADVPTMAAPSEVAPARREQLRPLTLRIPEELHRALTYIAENGSKSMNQFAIDALTPASNEQIVKIKKRKELGLD